MGNYDVTAMSDYYNNVQKIIKGQKILEESTNKANKARELQVASISGVAALTYDWSSANSDLIDSETRLALGLRDIDKLMKDSGGTFNDIDGKIELVSSNINFLKGLLRTKGWNVEVFNDLQRNLALLGDLEISKAITDINEKIKALGTTFETLDERVTLLKQKLRLLLHSPKKESDEWVKSIKEAASALAKLQIQMEITDELKNGLTDMFVSLGESLGNLFSGTKNPFKGLLTTLVDVVLQLGKILIGVGTFLMLIPTMQGFATTYLLAGLGIVTLGTVASNAIAGMKQGGVVPQGYPNDSYPARLTSGEMVLPPEKLPEFERQETQIKVVVEGVTKGKDIHYIVKEVLREYNNSF
jgi:hypothetical protein